MPEPNPPPDRPAEPMSDSARAFFESRAAVRAGMATTADHATQTVRALVASARYCALPVPAELDEVIAVLARWGEGVRALLARERAVQQHSGISAAEYQRAVERARVLGAITRGQAGGQR